MRPLLILIPSYMEISDPTSAQLPGSFANRLEAWKYFSNIITKAAGIAESIPPKKGEVAVTRAI